MSSRHPCISYIATVVVIITVSKISNAGASPPVSSTVTQNLQELSDAIHELTKAVSDHSSCNSVGTPPPQCQTMSYELAVSIGEIKAKVAQVSHAVEADANQVASLEDRLQKVETIVSHGLEVPPSLEEKLQNQCQALQAAVDRVAYLEDRVQKVETITSHGLQVSPDLEDRLQNQAQAVQGAVNNMAHFDQRLQQVQTIASQTQENFQDHVEEEASRKGSCRSPFYKVGDDCLYVDYVHKISWENARKLCRAFGGDLAVPSDVLKLRNFLINFGKLHFWIGGYDPFMDGNWHWLNGSEVDLSVGWAPGEPNNPRVELCLQYSGPSNWLLHDNTCSKGLHFVCQDTTYAQ